MKEQISTISEKLISLFHERGLGIIDVIQDVPPIFSILEQGYRELKEIVSSYKFPTLKDEICFFREIKPQLFSKLIFLQKIYQLKLNRPVSNEATLKIYLEQEYEKINTFFSSNLDFIQYYRSGKTSLDKYHFSRGNHEMLLSLESIYLERDSKFSTLSDFKVAKLLANEMYAAYLNCELARINCENLGLGAIIGVQSNEKWTDSKAALAEIVYGIHLLHSVNGGNIDIKVLATIFSKMFNVDLSDIYHIFLAIRNRKGDRIIYLNRMIEALNKRMDELDNK